jgi:hypothetical protein
MLYTEDSPVLRVCLSCDQSTIACLAMVSEPRKTVASLCEKFRVIGVRDGSDLQDLR